MKAGARALVRCSARCGGSSDMVCAARNPLEELLDKLADAGYEAHFEDIDALMARSLFSVCTNCTSRGRFTYTGMRSEYSYRAFWSCRRCGHWMEV